MKTLLVLSCLLCASFAAPAEDKGKSPDGTVQQKMAIPEMGEKMVKDGEVSVPEDSVPVPRDAPVSEEEAAPEFRFDSCPAGWFSHGSRCFTHVRSSMSWYDAEEHCNSMGAQLASATNPKEYRFLQQLTQAAGYNTAWLGGFNLQGRWMWIDREGFYYLNWYNLSPPSSRACVNLHISVGWSNNVCGTSSSFICSKNAFGC
uniref:C-type lectin domain-containing protein n=1 Tax=Gasterosteus aculeatus aculeatus TaxID=481459 RepID=A0AAQ4PUN2_GASAC|nr:galactose-specific lectin nattectin-like isoform X1 [Gasterosteus aculeatus aculeatus]